MSTPRLEISSLEDLKGLRSAPPLDAEQRARLGQDLRQRLSACEWFTVGVMAPSAGVALASLRALEQALGWTALELPADELPEGPVFLKGNQRSGQALLRPELGLGEGLLISGQAPSNPDGEDTWGPLPLDFFTSGPG